MLVMSMRMASTLASSPPLPYVDSSVLRSVALHYSGKLTDYISCLRLQNMDSNTYLENNSEDVLVFLMYAFPELRFI